MSLPSLLLKLPQLARFSENKTESDFLSIIEQVAGILSDWPLGFYAFIRSMEAEHKAQGTAYRKRHEKFYSLFFKGGAYRSDMQWLREAFIRYGLENAQDSIVDKRLLHDNSANRRFITKSELARYLGVSKVTLVKWFEADKINLTVLRTQKQKRYIADTSRLDLKPPQPGSGIVFNYREAATYIGLPVAVLAKLKARGRLPSQYRIRLKGGYHQIDLDAFKADLLRLSPAKIVDMSHQDCVSLSHALSNYHFHSTDRKTDFIEDYMRGSIRSVGKTEESLNGIQFSRMEVIAYVEHCREMGAGSSLSQQRAAGVLECNIAAVPGLLAQGYLNQGPSTEGTRVTLDSITSFAKQYVPLGKVAHILGTNTNRLVRLSEKENLKLLVITQLGKSTHIYFLAKQDVSTLKELHEQSPNRGRAPKNLYRNRSVIILQSYFDSLKLSGNQLPMHNGAPNLKAIAQACGLDRNVFYRNKTVQAMLLQYL